MLPITNLPSWVTGQPCWKESNCNQHSSWWVDAHRTNFPLVLSYMYSYPMQSPRCHAMFKQAARKQIRNSTMQQICKGSSTQLSWDGTLPRIRKRKPLRWETCMTAHAFTLWTQMDSSSATTKDSWVDQLKPPTPPHSSWILQQMTIHFILTMSCLPRHPWNSVT